jgi:hypothetical protein
MNTHLFLQIVTVTVALVCMALVPVVIRRDPGLTRRVVRMDAIEVPRWPGLLTRIGAGCLLVSFAMLVLVCYFILADAPY